MAEQWRRSPLVILAAVLGGVLLAGTGLVLAVWRGGAFFVLVAIGLAVFVAWQLRGIRSVVLRVDNRGLYDRRLSERIVPWQEIRGWRVLDDGVVEVDLKPSEQDEAQLGPVSVWIRTRGLKPGQARLIEVLESRMPSV